MIPQRTKAENFIVQLVRSMLTHTSRMKIKHEGSTIRITVTRPDQGRLVGRGGSNIYAIRNVAEMCDPPLHIELTEPIDLDDEHAAAPWSVVEAVEAAIAVIPCLAGTKVKVDPVAEVTASSNVRQPGEQERMHWLARSATDIKTVRAMEKIALAIAIVRGNKTFVEVEA